MQDVPIFLLVDTGAYKSIISVDFLTKIKEHERPDLERVNISMMTATGEVSPFYGNGKFSLIVNEKNYIQEIWVADIKNDGILGMDFLMKHNCDVLLSQQKLKLNWSIIPCFKSSIAANCCRVIVAMSTCVPANSEAVVQEKVIDAPEMSEFVLMESSEQFSDRYNLLVAASVLNVSGNSVSIRLMNLTDQDINLHKNSLVSMC